MCEVYDLANVIENQISEVTRQLKAENSINTTGEKAQYKSSHFDEANILVHLRMNTRTDEQGNKVLFLEEVQSDFNASYRNSQNEVLSFIVENEDEVIELYKKNGNLAIEC